MSLGDSVGICKQHPGKSLFFVGDNFPATKALGRTTVSFLFAGPWLVEDFPLRTKAERDKITARGG